MNNFWEIQIEKTYFRCQSLFLLGTTRIEKKLTGHYWSHIEYSIYTIQGLKVENGAVSNGQTIGLELKQGVYLLIVKNTEGTFSQTIKIMKL